MTSARVHTQSTAVALLGSFNPRIFEPLWFSRNELISEQEAEQAEVQMIDRDFCRLRLDWIELVVVGERLQRAPRARPSATARYATYSSVC